MPDMSPERVSAGGGPSLTQCRLTLVGSRRRIDLAVPGDLPLAELLLDVVRLLDEPDAETDYRAWGLGRLGHETLPPDRSLADLGVLDGEVLYLRDQHRVTAPTRVEDVIEGVQDSVEADPQLWRPDLRVRLALWMAGLVALVASAAAVRLSDVAARSRISLVAAVGAAVLLCVALGLQRVVRRPVSAAGSAITAWPVAAAAGVLAISSDNVATRIAGGAAGLAVALVLSAVAVPAIRPVALGVAPGVALLLGAAGAVSVGTQVPGTAGVAAFLAVVLVSVLPRLAIGAGRLATLDETALSGVPVRAEELSAGVRDAHRMLAWSVAALGLVALPCLVLVALAGTSWSLATAALLALALVLRARGFVLAREIVPLVVVGAAGLLVVTALLLARVGPDVRPFVAAGVATITVWALLVAGSLEVRPAVGARMRRWLDGLERIVVVISVPVLAGMLGLYTAVIELVS